jgi:hypothetical protein
MRSHYAHVPGKKNMRCITSQPCPLRHPVQQRLVRLYILWRMEDANAPAIAATGHISADCRNRGGPSCTLLFLRILRLC